MIDKKIYAKINENNYIYIERRSKMKTENQENDTFYSIKNIQIWT